MKVKRDRFHAIDSRAACEESIERAGGYVRVRAQPGMSEPVGKQFGKQGSDAVTQSSGTGQVRPGPSVMMPFHGQTAAASLSMTLGEDTPKRRHVWVDANGGYEYRTGGDPGDPQLVARVWPGGCECSIRPHPVALGPEVRALPVELLSHRSVRRLAKPAQSRSTRASVYVASRRGAFIG